jgi:uncharacterized protein DUF6176
MLRVAIERIHPDKEQRLRAWLAELNSRAAEVRATFREETVRAEQAYIVSGQEGPLLVYVIEADDLARGAKAFAASSHPIDAEQKAVMRECLAGSLKLKPLYDVSLGSAESSP